MLTVLSFAAPFYLCGNNLLFKAQGFKISNFCVLFKVQIFCRGRNR